MVKINSVGIVTRIWAARTGNTGYIPEKKKQINISTVSRLILRHRKPLIQWVQMGFFPSK
jgi:hypothetical protein